VSWSEPIEPVPTTPPPGPVSYGPGVLDDLADDGSGRRWWLAVLVGLFMIGLGLWMLANLIESVLVLALVIGVSLITGGILDAFVLGSRSRPRWAGWIEGFLLVGTGMIVLAWPDITLYVLAVTGGLALGLGGLIHLGIAVAHRNEPGGSFELGLGVLFLVLGGMVLAWPEATLVVLAVLFGVRAIVVGALAVGAGWQMRRRHALGAASAPF
jgi:uncharacterized membrane protein HdeD (DUF308 family)